MTNRTTGKPRSTATRAPARRSREASSSAGDKSAFSWAGNGRGAMVGAALAGAAIGLMANFGRKLLVQGVSASAGDWDEMLAAEHQATLALFDKMLATDPSQTVRRPMLLAKLQHALDKHAHAEEAVVYPALRQANDAHDADLLETEHGDIKTYLNELGQMAADAPNWLEKVAEFRATVASHARMEEEEVFPRLKQTMSEDQNDKITGLVNKDQLSMA